MRCRRLGAATAIEFDPNLHLEEAPPEAIEPMPSEPKPDFRTWTSANGQSTFDAQLIKKEGESITLKRKDNGQVITVPLSAFSQADQDFVKSLPF